MGIVYKARDTHLDRFVAIKILPEERVADAMARAHGAGIIQRDVKPSNLMVDEHGVVKVLDFALRS